MSFNYSELVLVVRATFDFYSKCWTIPLSMHRCSTKCGFDLLTSMQNDTKSFQHLLATIKVGRKKWYWPISPLDSAKVWLRLWLKLVSAESHVLVYNHGKFVAQYLYNLLPMSPYYLPFVMNHLMEDVQDEVPWCMSFADHVALISSTKKQSNLS